MVEKARQLLADIDAGLVQKGQIPQVVYIFRSKNYYGMRDETTQIVHHASDADSMTDADIMRKYGPMAGHDQTFESDDK